MGLSRAFQSLVTETSGACQQSPCETGMHLASESQPWAPGSGAMEPHVREPGQLLAGLRAHAGVSWRCSLQGQPSPFVTTSLSVATAV